GGPWPARSGYAGAGGATTRPAPLSGDWAGRPRTDSPVRVPEHHPGTRTEPSGAVELARVERPRHAGLPLRDQPPQRRSVLTGQPLVTGGDGRLRHLPRREQTDHRRLRPLTGAAPPHVVDLGEVALHVGHQQLVLRRVPEAGDDR